MTDDCDSADDKLRFEVEFALFTTVQSTVKWLEKDKQLLTMTENVDYDVEGTLAVLSSICSVVSQ